MTTYLASSGTMSMGGSDTTRSLNCALGRSGTAEIQMNEACVRSLGSQENFPATYPIKLGVQFYCKPFLPPAIGGSYGGGYFIGTCLGREYYYVVAPNSSGCAECRWKTVDTTTGSCGNQDGFINTYCLLANAAHPAGNWTATRTIGGFSNWYLSARAFQSCEGEAMLQARNQMPAGEGYPTGLPLDLYWTSNETYVSCASTLRFDCQNAFNSGCKNNGFRVRAIRRIRACFNGLKYCS